MDTRSTVPMESQGSPAGDGPSPLLLSDLLQLSKDELGAWLFLEGTGTQGLSPGAKAFFDWVRGDFLESAEHILDASDVGRFETLFRVYEITKDLVTEAIAKAAANVEFKTVVYDKVMSTAQQAVAKVVQQAGAAKDDEAKKQRARVAEAWLKKEAAGLDSKKRAHAAAATKAATFAAGKLHCFIAHLREANLLSSTFVGLMETWQELDACDSMARRLKPAEHEKQMQFADTQVDVQTDTLLEKEDDGSGRDDQAESAPEAPQAAEAPEAAATQIFVPGDGAQEELILSAVPDPGHHQCDQAENAGELQVSCGRETDPGHEQCDQAEVRELQVLCGQEADPGHQKCDQAEVRELQAPCGQGADPGHQTETGELQAPSGQGADPGHHTTETGELQAPSGQGADPGHQTTETGELQAPSGQEADPGHLTTETGELQPSGHGADPGHLTTETGELQPSGHGADPGHLTTETGELQPSGHGADPGHQTTETGELQPCGQGADPGHQTTETGELQPCGQGADPGHQQCHQVASTTAEIINCDEIPDDELVSQLEADPIPRLTYSFMP
ncbi:F5 [Symbiodinium sp. CCMP2592]|nr:F5 [Symbiodinium sp. CCMP2592]